MDVILGAIGEILSFKILLIMSVACVAGLTAGALPGFTAVMAVALLVPFTFTMTPVAGLAALGTLYCATIFGGSFT
ncbi:tripartite tricarboxylate transporter permease, partial [Desulfovibrio sp. OttesenSCG-928-O18]|nr:tripartite tricarboxylate transporter permease [Desulfovibrio sp. OttesenSCG-928-O18]